ncbi:MAG: ABC transporter ATP-binding protein [Gammaproteobacteria bacterium]|nr:ABC transporter ATP-binding protein [Gammaproteobacteria bacterium]
MLSLRDVHTFYARTQVLHGLCMEVERGSVAALLGRNGAGKTTTLRSIMRLTPHARGHIRIAGRDIDGLRPHHLARMGVAYLPEARGLFASLSVAEHLRLAVGRRHGPWNMDCVLEMFPRLRERAAIRATALSGGEQQMLGLARALLLNPELLILDEPTEGLAPIIIDELLEHLRAVKTAGMTVLLVEQNLRFATALADRVHVLGRGRVQWSGDAQALRDNEPVQREWLGV